MKPALLLPPLLALGACATEDLEIFAAGLSMAAYELEQDFNPSCPAGLYRQHVADAYAMSYPSAPWQVDYQLNPMGGGYSYCAAPLDPGYYDGHYDGRRRHRRDGDDDYRDGYRDGYRDSERDDRRDDRRGDRRD